MITLTLLLALQDWKSEILDTGIPMRDGKKLAADIFLPSKPGKYPTVLIQTPYNKKHLGKPIGSGEGDGGEVGRGAVSDTLGLLDREHYAYVVVDWRGFFASKAAMDGINKRTWRRGQDGYDCVEWIAAQSWSDGKVGTWGGSALGKIQFDTALEHPPHLVCAVPLIAALGQEYSFYYPGGVYLEAHVKTLDVLGFGVSATAFQHPRESDQIWTLAKRATYTPEKIDVPCLLITGWWDHFPDQIIRTFEDLVSKGGEAARKHSRLLVGPWDHVSIGVSKQGDRTFPGAEKASADAARAFFDFHLRGVGAGLTQKRIRYWEINGDRWLEADSWSGLARKSDSITLKGDRLQYTCDPKSPTPTLGGANLPPLPHGPTDHRALEKRKDVLVFTWDRPVRMNGTVELSFDVEIDRPSCDFIARLCDVRDGKDWHLGDAVLRIREKKAKVVLKFPATAASCSSIRVYLAGSNWPRYERNPHTGEDHWNEKTAVPVQVVLSSAPVLRVPVAAE